MSRKKVLETRDWDYGQWTVPIKVKGDVYYMDVWIENKELLMEWNQYIFDRRDDGDMLREEFQSNSENYDFCSNRALYFLEKNGEIIQLNNGDWSCGIHKDNWDRRE